jgi:hypothetical protein
MTSAPSTRERAGGDALMFIIMTSLVLVVAGICAFIVFAAWWLLPFVMLGLILSAGAVIFSISLLMDTDSPIPSYSPKPRAESELAPAAAPAPVRSAIIPGH